MAVIHVLDKHTAELIAAGEVVERPASVVKELLENAIDAGATQVSVAIEKGGVSLIQVTDNGSGIEAEYISTAFIRHATSKISCEQDLESIHTLGFRGEALASIASVARVEVLTRTEPDEFACRYRIEGGEEQGMEPAARPVGTTITVRDLFYNTPARMKFLKKDASEGAFVGETVSRIALSHPEVSIAFVREGKQLYKTPGDGSLKSAAYAVLGRDFAKDLLPVEDASGSYRVSGLVTPPRACRASRGMQFFFINGRFVKNRTMMAALENAYRGTLMQGKFPGCVLALEMPAQLVDVNVHPAKTEVRFSRESDVFDAVYRAVKAALAQPGSGEQRFSFSKQTAMDEPEQMVEQLDLSTPVKQPTITHSAPPPAAKPAPAAGLGGWGSEPTVPRPAPAVRPAFTAAPVQQETLRSEPLPLDAAPVRQPVQPAPEPVSRTQEPAPVPEPEPQVQAVPAEPQQEAPQEEPLEYIGEAFKTYIITQRGDELCLIDKHAAHERILYEQLAAGYGAASSQLLLAPVTVNLSAAEKAALLENAGLLNAAGVQAEDFGGSTMLVRAVPADVQVSDVEGLLCELADRLARGSRETVSEKTQWVMHSIACKAAIKAGDKSDRRELMALAQDILNGKVPPFCPHGRPVVLKLTKKELEKQFGRLG
ncbi:DNA mismatch repair endonuclease MutL [Candidatus Allofournierella merdipullorum]|uniref:DNA mismatch repair endonuclease MutL n=1 Tax=Candidatus Allofournierella merdipullorum TaxID=2838595 RepID=UPI002A8DCEBC|nr:DNA mismatch repair endonuclease MutL [Candidatus Fournierella merdipullorum]